jgi:transcriptional regulator with XRE-family HTH domain
MPQPTRELTNEAQRLLLEAKVTLGQLATACGVSREAARKWLAGGRPDPAKRKTIRKRFGVAEDAWELAPTVAAPAAAGGRASEGPPAPTTDARSAAREFLDGVRKRRKELENKNAAAAELMRLLELERRAIVDFARFNGELTAADESRLTETPRFQRVKRAILEALKPHPKALATVARALDELGA